MRIRGIFLLSPLQTGKNKMVIKANKMVLIQTGQSDYSEPDRGKSDGSEPNANACNQSIAIADC